MAKFLPSFNIYTQELYNQYLDDLLGSKKSYQKYQDITGQDSLVIHLDNYLPLFAKDNCTDPSMAFELILMQLEDEIRSRGYDGEVVMNVHSMGLPEDEQSIWDILSSFSGYEGFKWTFYFTHNFYNQIKEDKLGFEHNLGIWYDNYEWVDRVNGFVSDLDVLDTPDILLMTSKAGKSGGKLNSEIIEKAYKVSNQFENKKFVFDGGWSVDHKKDSDNVEIVSHNSFWKTFKSL